MIVNIDKALRKSESLKLQILMIADTQQVGDILKGLNDDTLYERRSTVMKWNEDYQIILNAEEALEWVY